MPYANVFLWHGSALYLGQGRDSSIHQHNLIQIGVSFTDPFAIALPDTPEAAYQSFIVAPNTLHRILSANRTTLFAWTEPESFAGHHLLAYLDTQKTNLCPLPHHLTTQLSWPVLESIASCQEATIMFQHLMQEIMPGPPVTAVYDERIQQIIALLKQKEFIRDIAAISQLANTVHLSPSRLRHLFKQQIGLSLQQYLLWQRLLHAMQAGAAGMSLTEAAHSAGFADSAHLSRTFRRTFGLTPSEIFNDSHSVQVYACQG